MKKLLTLLFLAAVGSRVFAQPITSLPEITSTADGSWVAVVDSATGKDRKMKKKNLFGGTPIAFPSVSTTTISPTELLIVKKDDGNLRRISRNDLNKVVGNQTYTVTGTETKTLTGAGLYNFSSAYAVKGSSTIKLFSGASGSIFSYKRSSTDSSYLLLKNLSSRTAGMLFSQGAKGSAYIQTYGSPEIGLVSAGIFNSSSLGIDSSYFSVSCLGVINNTAIQMDSISLITSSSYTAFPGSQYADDYSANFTARSLIDKGYADNLVNTSAWKITGNSGTTAGTNFVGTSDSIDLVFKTNGIERMRVTRQGGKVGIGTNNPSVKLEVTGDLVVDGTTALITQTGIFTSASSDFIDVVNTQLVNNGIATLNWNQTDLTENTGNDVTLNWTTRALSGNWTAATQTVVTNNATIATCAYVDNIGGAGYKDSTSVRAFATNYNPNATNSTFVTASFSLETALASQARVQILVNGVVIQTVQSTTVALSLGQTIIETVTFIVPKDTNYRFNNTDTGGGTSTIVSVFEMKL